MEAIAQTEIQISDIFDVKLTSYGGRACFAKTEIPAGTTILKCPEPLSHTILYEFRKEVCHHCWTYTYGETCKVRLDPANYPVKGRKFTGAGLWFCSQDCMNTFTMQPASEELVRSFDELQHGFQTVAKRPQIEMLIPDSVDDEMIDSAWEEVAVWESQISKTKKSKWMNQAPKINEEDYIMARFVTQALHYLMFSEDHQTLEIFSHLQSNERSKIKEFPVLLTSQVNTYKFLFVMLPPPLKELLTIDKFRQILGAEYGNAFGIWQQTVTSEENREYLGYALFPQASYFNHSCSPNLVKIRVDNRMHFVTKSDIKLNEQLCIEYGDVSAFGIKERQEELQKNWFFKCGCSRCVIELAQV